MASIDEVARLIVEAEAKGFAEVEAKIKGNQAALDALTTAHKAGTVGLDEYLSHGQRLQAEIGHLGDAYEVAEKAVKRYGSYADASAALAEKASRGSREWQQRITGLSYSMNDFFGVSGDLSQRLNAIANNLPMLLSGFGSLGLVLSGIVPIIGMVIKNWDGLKKAFGFAVEEMGSRVEQLKAKIKELEDKKIKLPVEVMELENARKEVEAIQEALAAVDKLRKNQQHYEKESGAAVSGLLSEATDASGKAISGEDIQARLKRDMVADLERTSGPLNEARQKQADIEARIADQEKLADFLVKEGGAGTDAQVQANIEKLRKGLEVERQKAIAAKKEIDRVGGTAEEELGKILDPAEHGSGDKQITAQKRLAERLNRAGLGNLAAGIVDEQGNARLAPDRLMELDKIDDEFDAAEEAGKKVMAKNKAAAAKAQAAFKQTLTDELDVLKGIGGIDELADKLTDEAKAKGLQGNAAFAHVKKGLDESIKGALADRGFKTPAERQADANETIGDLATQAAKSARVKDAGQGKADAQKMLDAQNKDVEDRQKAEVKRIKDSLGKPLQEQFEREAAANQARIAAGAPIARNAREEQTFQGNAQPYALPPAELQRRAAANTARFLQRERGATPEAARQAAAEIVGSGQADAVEAQAQGMLRPAPVPRGPMGRGNKQAANDNGVAAQTVATNNEMLGAMQAGAGAVSGAVNALQAQQGQAANMRRVFVQVADRATPMQNSALNTRGV